MPKLELAEGHIEEVYKGEGEAPKLIYALEKLPGVKFSMCNKVNPGGAPNNPFMIFLKIKNFYSMTIIARAFDRRYSGTHFVYKVSVETSDAESSNGTWPTFTVMISTDDYYESLEQYNDDMLELAGNIRFWQKEEYDAHFFKGKYNITL